MGIKTSSCEERTLLRLLGRRFTVDLPLEHAGWLAGAQAVAAGASLALAASKMPLPMSLAFQLISNDTGSVSFAVVGYNQFGDLRQETVTISTTANVIAYGRTSFAYERVTSITLSSGALDGDNGVKVEYVAVGVSYHNPAGACLYGLPFAIRGLTDIEMVTLDSQAVASPTVQTTNFWTLTLPSVARSAGRLTIHFRAEAIDKY